ncbi:MAG: LamG domain-containing protein [Candidatus Marsarchaeota archaeon]|nr:LamG domain-containing protein [Candidatus Marsarchaeota archaeon]
MMTKAQSAMEYLMTYGWAILIIAVVLGALFQLGVFNSGTFAPRAPPGACQVFRPNGPNTASLINLEGVCNGELPQYVANLTGTGGVTISSPNGEQSGTQPITATYWFNEPNPAGEGEVHFFSYGQEVCPSQAFTVGVANPSGVGHNYIDTWCTQIFTTPTVNANVWYFGIGQINATSERACIAGPSISSVSCATEPITANVVGSTPIYLGTWPNRPDYVGKLANIQFYNASLTLAEVNALYAEGIGGAPIKLQNLVAWWPLNGNANDYSGNNNNGVPSGVTYTNQWASGYTPP